MTLVVVKTMDVQAHQHRTNSAVISATNLFHLSVKNHSRLCGASSTGYLLFSHGIVTVCVECVCVHNAHMYCAYMCVYPIVLYIIII